MQSVAWPWPKNKDYWPFDTLTNFDMTNTVTILKPCPFCGSGTVAHITVPQYERPGLPNDSWVQCSDCGAEIHSTKINLDMFSTPVELWNTRA